MSVRRLVLAAAALSVAVLGAACDTARADTPPSDRQTVAAPIDALDVTVAGTQATLHVKAGLPSGCAKRDTYKVERAGDTITVSVTNTIPTGPVACTMIYGNYDLSIDLGSSFAAGRSYTVRVNDKTATFKI